MKISGIYKIVNKIDGKYYVGSSKNIFVRWKQHRRTLNKQIHKNLKLQYAWNKYGESNFEFIITEKCTSGRSELLVVEQVYLNTAKNEQNKCYNLSFIAGSIEFTNEVREKLSKKLKGRVAPNRGVPHSTETKIKMSKAQTGSLHSMFGKSPSEETRKKLRDSRLGKKNHFFGKTHTEETKCAIRNAHTNLTDDDVLYIRNYPKYRGSGVKLSKKFNMSTSNISSIRSGRLWSHLITKSPQI
jgi:group I intron endonuclease